MAKHIMESLNRWQGAIKYPEGSSWKASGNTALKAGAVQQADGGCWPSHGHRQSMVRALACRPCCYCQKFTSTDDWASAIQVGLLLTGLVMLTLGYIWACNKLFINRCLLFQTSFFFYVSQAALSACLCFRKQDCKI